MITVLITAYNSGRYIRQALNSALNQDFRGYEIFVVDDGSSDNTADQVLSFGKKIRYEKIDHCGRPAALNYGLVHASNDWIVLLDSDDLISREKLKLFSSYINDQENIILTNWAAYFKDQHIHCTVKFPTNHSGLQKFLLVHSFSNSVMYNRNFILKNGGYSTDVEAAEDHDLWLKLYDQAFFGCIPEYLTFHRMNGNSLSRKNFTDTRCQIRQVFEKYNIDQYNSRIPDVKERKNIISRRLYFYGNDKKTKDFDPAFPLRSLLNKLPEKFSGSLKNYNVKGRMRYLLHYYSTESKSLRKKLRGHTGDGNKIHLSRFKTVIRKPFFKKNYSLRGFQCY